MRRSFVIRRSTPSAHTKLVRGDVVLGDGSQDYGLTLYTATDSEGYINFADGHGSLQQQAGGILYDHSNFVHINYYFLKCNQFFSKVLKM